MNFKLIEGGLVKPLLQAKNALKRYFGYDSFRPLQEEIIRDALAGRDTMAILPT